MKIEFIPASKMIEDTVPPPEPAKNFIPDWYSSLKIFNGSKPKIYNGDVQNITVKSCGPFYDAMTAGYIQKTWCDIEFNLSDNGELQYNFSRAPEILIARKNKNIPIPNHCYDVEFAWVVPWAPKTPKGWSIIFSSPNNRYGLPFFCTDGIIDSDYFNASIGGKYPFYLKYGFTGIIPAGTPMYQMIPIKRESWKSKVCKFEEKTNIQKHAELKSHFFGAYKKLYHQKKYYK